MRASVIQPRRVLLVLLAVILVASPHSLLGQGELPGVLISRQLAESEQIAVGDTIRLAADARGIRAGSFRVVGFYEPTPDPSRLGTVAREVRLHLPDLLDLTREPSVPAGAEHVGAINVALTDAKDAAAFAADVNTRLPGVVARSTAEAAGAAGPFLVLERFHLAIAVVTIVAATVFLLALTVMLVDERRETVGILRLIGLPARRILVQITSCDSVGADAGQPTCRVAHSARRAVRGAPQRARCGDIESADARATALHAAVPDAVLA